MLQQQQQVLALPLPPPMPLSWSITLQNQKGDIEMQLLKQQSSQANEKRKKMYSLAKYKVNVPLSICTSENSQV